VGSGEWGVLTIFGSSPLPTPLPTIKNGKPVFTDFPFSGY